MNSTPATDSYLQLLRLPTFDLTLDRRPVTTITGIVVGYCHVINRVAYVRNNAQVNIHPDYRGQGIETYLTRWAEARARQFIPLAPAGRLVTLGCAVIYPSPATQNMLESQGFQRVRYFSRLRIELAAPFIPHWPEGITVRHKRVGQDEEGIYRAIDETFKIIGVM